MQKEDAIRLIAAELDVFHMDADAEGNYAARLSDGTNLRVLPKSGDCLILEAQLLPDVATTVRSPETLMELLTNNFPRSIVHSSVFTYLREFDEFALSQLVLLQDCSEEILLKNLEGFLGDARDLARRIRDHLTSTSTLPSNSTMNQ
jgi:hypothetical protein